jgi:hypothetical protein
MLAQAQSTLTSGDERPFPGGFANGVGNEFPVPPDTRCGITLVPKKLVANVLR